MIESGNVILDRGKPEIIVKKSGSSTQENDECDKMSTSKETQRSDNMKTLPAEVRLTLGTLYIPNDLTL